MAEESKKRQEFKGGPDERSTKNLDNYYDRVVDLNDQLKFTISLIEDRTTIEKKALNLSNQLVDAVQKMKTSYRSTKEVQQDLTKFQSKSNELEIQKQKIA